MSDDPKQKARSSYGGALPYYEADVREIKALRFKLNQLQLRANERWQQLYEWADTGGRDCVAPPIRQDLGELVAPDEHPRVNSGKIQAEAAARALAAAPPGALERIARLKQREKEEEARIARSLPRLAPVGPVAAGNL